MKLARDILQSEKNALKDLSESLDSSFCEAVELMWVCQGRVVVTGIGKSAIIAQKIVATLNSTGRPALFMHAADAIHGDLGMIQSQDVVLCLSKSGESPEIKVLVPLLLRLGNPMIGMTARADSFLARHSQCVLLTPMTHEADPLQLAPTTSTILQMAMGDALAMAIQQLNGFTAHDFARVHPGGALGKQLYLKVSDLCDMHPRPKVSRKDNIRTALLEITGKRLGATAVLEDDGTIAGIITDGDLRRMIQQNDDFIQLSAEEVMTRSPRLIDYHDYAVNALRMIEQYQVSQLIAVRDGEYMGMVHFHDLVREGIV